MTGLSDNPFFNPAQPLTGQVEQSSNYDRARLGYFANRVLVYDLLDDVADVMVFEVPENTTILIRSMWAINNSGGSSTFFFKILPVGKVAGTWPCKHEESIASKDTLEWWEIDEVLEPGYQLLAWASGPGDILLKINGVYVGGQ